MALKTNLAFCTEQLHCYKESLPGSFKSCTLETLICRHCIWGRGDLKLKAQEDTGHDEQHCNIGKRHQRHISASVVDRQELQVTLSAHITGMPLEALGQRRCSRMKGGKPELKGVLLKSSPGTEEHVYPSMVSCITAFPGHLLMAQETNVPVFMVTQLRLHKIV